MTIELNRKGVETMLISNAARRPQLRKARNFFWRMAIQKTTLRGITGLVALFGAYTFTALASDTASYVTNSLSLRGTSAHGANFFNGEVITRYDNAAPYLSAGALQFWQNFSVREVGVLDDSPAATDGLTITTATPRSALMATVNSGIAPTQPHQLNNPIHNTPIISGLFTSDRSYLPAAAPEIGKFDPVRNPDIMEPVTLRRWESAKGRIHLSCLADGSGTVEIRARNLLPGIPYTVWAVFATNEPTLFGFLEANPMGGVPNIITANERGSARFERKLHYCPLATNEPLMYVALYAHWDTAVYGGNPDAGDQGFPTGVVGGDQLVFVTGDNLHRVQYW